MLQILLNGEPHEIDAQTSVRDLLGHAGYADRRVAVEVNREIVPRSAHAQRVLLAGDQVEIVHALGGG